MNKISSLSEKQGGTNSRTSFSLCISSAFRLTSSTSNLTMHSSPIATLPGFPFFYAIPIDGHIREIPSQPQIWSEEMEGFAEDGDTLLLFHPPPYSKPPKQSVSGPLPVLEEVDETLSMITSHYLPIIVPDDDMITPETVRAKTEPITKTKTQRRKIRYPSLPIGRWAQPSPKYDTPSKDINDYGKTVPHTPENKRKLRFPSISSRSTWSSFRPSLSSPLSASAAASATSINPHQVLIMPPELEAIEAVSPISPFNELDSTPVSELSSERSSEQSTPTLPEAWFGSLPELQFTAILYDEQQSSAVLPDRSPYRSWYEDDDAEGLSVPSHSSESDPPPHHSEDSSPPPHSDSDISSSPSSSPVPSLDTDSGSNCSSNRSSQWSQDSKDFEGDIKESIPDMASLPARPQSILLMTEEEICQAGIIEDIFLMLHNLQPNYLHPAHRPQPNVVRASMIRRFATQIARSRSRGNA
jgi:hypothetical protein